MALTLLLAASPADCCRSLDHIMFCVFARALIQCQCQRTQKQQAVLESIPSKPPALHLLYSMPELTHLGVMTAAAGRLSSGCSWPCWAQGAPADPEAGPTRHRSLPGVKGRRTGNSSSRRLRLVNSTGQECFTNVQISMGYLGGGVQVGNFTAGRYTSHNTVHW